MKSVVLFLVSLLIAGGIFELGARIGLKYFVGYSLFNSDHMRGTVQLTIFDNSSKFLPVGIKPNTDQIYRREEFATAIHINNVGWREDFDYHGEPIDIGFVGDSFTFGHGVEAGERYSNRLKARLGQEQVVSFSYLNGWTPPHYYLFFKNNPQWVPRRAVVMGLFLGNDLTGDIDETDFKRDSAGELISAKSKSREANEEGMLFPKGFAYHVGPFARILERSSSGQLLLIAYGLVRGTYRNVNSTAPKAKDVSSFHVGTLEEKNLIGLEFVRKTRDLLAKSGCELIVFIIPEAFMVGDYPYLCPYEESECTRLRTEDGAPESVEKWLIRSRIRVVNPVKEFRNLELSGRRLYLHHDGHWNREGHDEASRLLASIVQ